jgi:hypothetical protein
MPGLPPPRHIPTLPSNLATSAHSGLTTIEAVEDGWCRRCISHAMASGSQTVRLRRARAARSAETGFAPGHGGFTARAWFGLSPVRGNRLDRRLCSANVIMEPRWRPAKQRCPDPATAPSVAPSIPESLLGRAQGRFCGPVGVREGRRPRGRRRSAGHARDSREPETADLNSALAAKSLVTPRMQDEDSCRVEWPRRWLR